MTAEELLDRVAAMLGFRVTERENDAVLIRDTLKTSQQGLYGSRSVRPATREEVTMFLRLLGLVARMDEIVSENSKMRQANNELQERIAESSKDSPISSLQEAIAKMGLALQAADYRIKELMTANRGLGDERNRMEARIAGLDSELRDVYGRNEDIEEKLKEAGLEV